MKFYEKMQNVPGYYRRKQFSIELWDEIHKQCHGCPSISDPVCKIEHENRNTKCQCGKTIWNVYSVHGRIDLDELGSECLRALPCYRYQKALVRNLP